MEISSRRTLGRSGLPVSPLALGTMTFGNKTWGSTDEVAESIFNSYVDSGGNFIDTADVYSGGRSEELVGAYIQKRGLRDGIVLATKFSFNGGNGRKNCYRALESSLRRLGTDYVDLYWMHVWDRFTPVEEMLQTLGDLVRAGKVRYFGLSDVPAWYATRMATLAQMQGVPGPIAMQLEYSLVGRTIEQEHLPAAMELGVGIVPWSPLAGGFLSGKYSQGSDSAGKGRLGGTNPFQGPYTKFTDRNWKILDALTEVSRQMETPVAQVALAWTMARPGITSLIVGATKPEQLEQNLSSLRVSLSPAQMAALTEVSAFEPGFPYGIFSDAVTKGIFGAKVEGWIPSHLD